MGVSLTYRIQLKNGFLSKERDIKVGWRSMAHGLLLDNGLLGDLGPGDIPTLERLAETQEKGVREPPFDWAQDIHDEFMRLAQEIRDHTTILVSANW